MILKDFIHENKEEIDQYLYDYYRVIVTNNRVRKEWIFNDRYLYTWAQQEGVNI